MVPVPRLEEPPVDEVEDLSFRRVRIDIAGAGTGRDDGVVIGDFRVVHVALAERTPPGTLGNEAFIVLGGHVRGNRGQLAGDRRGQVPTVGAGIGDGLVLFVQGLCNLERPLGAVSVQAVGMPLQFGEIVEEGRRHALGCLLDRLDIRSTGFRAPDDLGGLLAVGRQARLALAALELEIRTAIDAALARIEVGLDL